MVGYPTYSFHVLVDGSWDHFRPHYLAALRADEHISEFLKDRESWPKKWTTKRRTPEQILHAAYGQLVASDPSKVTPARLSNVLRQIFEVVSREMT